MVGDELRTLPANAAPAGDLQAALMEFAQAEAVSSGGGGAIAGMFVIVLLIAVAAGGAVLLVNRRRRRARRRQVGSPRAGPQSRTSCGSATGSGRSSST